MVAAGLQRVLAVAVLLLAGVPAGPALAKPSIVGGQTASQPYPYAAFIELHYADSSATAYCGGSLVAARYVVTAGHCLEDSPTRIDVTVGSAHVDHDAATPAEYVGVPAVRDPQFALTADEPVNDAAVLTLPAPAPEAQIRLPRPADAALWAPGTAATAVGWGRCGPGESACGLLPDDLREVAQPIRTDASCAADYQFAAASMLCAGGEAGRDTCTGDSGGPLVVGDGFGSPVLAGATSFGAALCGIGPPAVYTRVGAPAINAWLRSVVPQVEIDASTTTPAPGDVVTFTAEPHRPGGSGPFGGYDALSWDLDGNGSFGEADGQTTVQRPMPAGVDTVAVRATDGAGDAEVRTIHVRSADRAAVAFTSPGVTVIEGRSTVLTLSHVGTGAGTVTVTPFPAPGTHAEVLRPTGAQTVAFGPGDATRSVAFSVPDDRRHEPTQACTVALGDFTGGLVPGAATTATITVLDDDPAVRLDVGRRVRRGRVELVLRADRPGRFTTTVRDGAGHRAARGSRVRLRAAAHPRVRLRLTPRARRALARRHRLRVRVQATFTPSAGGGRTVTVRRTVTLRASR